MNGLVAFVFHFNRPGYLENAVASLERHLPKVPVVVMDDGSNDPAARASLASVGLRHEIVICRPQATMAERTGGLHANIQTALLRAAKDNQHYALMLQDDMQMVRPLDDLDWQAAERAFAPPDASFVLTVCFRKGVRRHRANERNYVAAGEGLCRRIIEEATPQHFAYSDVGLFDVRRFIALETNILSSEMANEHHFRRLGLRMSVLTAPFMHYLPFPITFRNRRRGIRASFADWLAGAGLHIIDDLTPVEILRLRQLPDVIPPFAEDWLRAPTAPDAKFWSLHGGRSNLLARGGWRGMVGRML